MPATTSSLRKFVRLWPLRLRASEVGAGGCEALRAVCGALAPGTYPCRGGFGSCSRGRAMRFPVSLRCGAEGRSPGEPLMSRRAADFPGGCGNGPCHPTSSLVKHRLRFAARGQAGAGGASGEGKYHAKGKPSSVLWRRHAGQLRVLCVKFCNRREMDPRSGTA